VVHRLQSACPAWAKPPDADPATGSALHRAVPQRLRAAAPPSGSESPRRRGSGHRRHRTPSPPSSQPSASLTTLVLSDDEGIRRVTLSSVGRGRVPPLPSRLPVYPLPQSPDDFSQKSTLIASLRNEHAYAVCAGARLVVAGDGAPAYTLRRLQDQGMRSLHAAASVLSSENCSSHKVPFPRARK